MYITNVDSVMIFSGDEICSLDENGDVLATCYLTLRFMETDISFESMLTSKSCFCYAGESRFMEMVVWAGSTPGITHQ